MFDTTIITPITLSPSRVRVGVKGLKHNLPFAQILRTRLLDLSGIHEVNANYHTGNLTVVFDETVISAAGVLAPTYRLAVKEPSTVELDNPYRKEVLTYGSLAAVSGGVLVYGALRRASSGEPLGVDSPLLAGLATATTIASGYPLLQKGLDTLARGKQVSPELILTVSSILLSLMRGNLLGLSVIFLVHLNNLLQSLIAAYAHSQLAHQFPVRCATYQIENGPELATVPFDHLKSGAIVRLSAGQIIPVDGRVLTGIAVVNELTHTGGVDTTVKSVDSAVWSGTRVEEGDLRVLALQVGPSTMLGQMLRGVEELRREKGEEPNATRTAMLGNFAVIGAALALALGRPQLALAVLLAGNPAPLQHARVLAFGSGSRTAFQNGILIRRPERLHALAKANVVLFDKSATLTEGRATIVDVIPINRSYGERELLTLAASAEQGSEHQFARALLEQAKKQRLYLRKAESQTFAGNGISAQVSNALLLLGNEDFMTQHGIDLHKSHDAVRRLRLTGASPVYLAKKDRLIGVIAIKDQLKAESHEAVETLRMLGMQQIGIVTGDSQFQGEQIGRALGINAVWAGLNPQAKMRLVQILQQQGSTVAVVGDGHNDLLAMGAADVSIALKTPVGSEALRVADMVVLDGDPRKVAQAVYLARHVAQLYTQNSIAAAAVNLLGVGSGLLGRVPIGAAALIPTLTSLGIAANSLRSSRVPPRKLKAQVEACATLATDVTRFTVQAFGEEQQPTPWHVLPTEHVIKLLGSCPYKGLTSKDVASRLLAYGKNELATRKQPPLWRMFCAQFNDFMIHVLLAAAALSLAMGNPKSAIITVGVVLFNAILGVWQELRNGRALEMLQRLTEASATVLRDGLERRIASSAVVPGDILLLEAGDKVAADARIISAQNLASDESPLTGESVPVSKKSLDLPATAQVADRSNLLYMGTVITRGRGKAVVVSTGVGTEMGQISAMMNNNVEVKTPLKQSLEELSGYITYGCLAISGLVLGLGLLRGGSLQEMLMLGSSLAVAAIPEGLASTVTIALAIGVQRMVKRGILIRKLPALETLGCTTVICSDKTGTLTKNEMTVRRLFAGGHLFTVTGEGYKPVGHFEREDGIPVIPASDPALLTALKVAFYCNNASVRGSTSGRNEQIIQGDPTEAALLVAALKGGLCPKREPYERVAEIPFESERRRMSVVCRTPDGSMVSYCKGAVDVMLDVSTHIWDEQGPRPMTGIDRVRIMEENKKMALHAMRVLALAVKPIDPDSGQEFADIDAGVTFVGLVAMIDPPRAEVQTALAQCRQAGIRVVMITGDQPLTAQAVARELGILTNPDRLMTGPEVDALTDCQLTKCVGQVQVFARTTPHHKLRIVQALKRTGQVVAMTGDGVNDALALTAAHIGIAMGSGTEVSKEAAAMVVIDDSFATIVTGIKEGRAVFSNIRKAIRYLLATNAGEVVAMALAALLGLPAPLTALQLLWVNLLGDGLPAIALINDPPSAHAMQGPPRHANDGVFSHGLGRKIVQRGLILGVTSLWAFKWSMAKGGSLLLARSVTLATVALSQFVHLFDIRSDRDLGKVNVFSNSWLVLAVLVSLALLVALIQVPSLQGLVGTTHLGLAYWLLAGMVAVFAALVDHFVSRFNDARLKPRLT